MRKPKGILEIRDNGGETVDRYTVVYSHPEKWGYPKEPRLYQTVCMSAYPFHLQGFGQHGAGMPGDHLGKRIKWETLPEDCRKLVMSDLGIPCSNMKEMDKLMDGR